MNINPDYYKGSIEVIDFIDAYKLNFCLGNVVKYVSRAGNKHEKGISDTDKAIEDLLKAKWYLEHEIQRRLENEIDKHCTCEEHA